MQESTILYNGKPVNKSHFRAFIYAADGASKLVNSWHDYQEHMGTGLWFADKGDIPVKPQKLRKKVS